MPDVATVHAHAHDATTGVLRDMAGAKYQVFNHCMQAPAANDLFLQQAMFQGLLAIIWRMLYASMADSRQLVANLPEGRRSTFMSVLNSL